MRLAVAIALGVCSLYGQRCAPSRLLPAGSVSGTLDGDSCLLSDGSAYQAYRLDLPVRGLLEVELPGLGGDLIVILRNASGAKVDSGVAIRRQVEAGQYTVLVNGRTAGQVGSYSLRTAFHVEPGMLCAGFAPLGVRQTVTGALGASGCTSPDGAPYEAYSLNSFGAGTLTVRATAADFTPRVIVRTSDGAAFGSTAGSTTAEFDAASRYEIVVYSEGGSGRYEITTSFEPSAEETCRESKRISEPAIERGTVNANSCATPNPETNDFAYFDYYSLTVPAAGLAEIAASSDAFTPTLTLLDESGAVIASDSGGASITGSLIRMPLKPGNYGVQVLSTIPSGGTYELSYNLTPGPPAACAISSTSLGAAENRTLEISTCRSALHGVSLPSAGTLDATLQVAGFAGILELRDAKDNLMLRGADGDEPGTLHLTADLPAGSYTIAVSAAWGAGPYQLTATHTAAELPKCDFAERLELDGGFVQKLGHRSCRDANGQPFDPYDFTLPEDSVVAVVMTSSEVDGRLTLKDSAGNALRNDDNSYGLRNPLIVQYLRAGTYRVEAGAAQSTAEGYYQVDLRTIPGERPPFCAPRGTIEMGGSVTGAINLSRCQYRDATFADLYEFRLSSETSVDLRLDSDEFDAHLIVLDAKGSLVGESDGGGDGTNAGFTDLLPAGTYYVVAKPLSEYRSAGAYRLSLGVGE